MTSTHIDENGATVVVSYEKAPIMPETDMQLLKRDIEKIKDRFGIKDR